MKKDTKSPERFEVKAERFRREQALYEDGEHLLLALSGGKDSVALLRLLVKERDRSKIRLSAAHVHHGLRESAEGDLEFCRRICEEYEVPFYFCRRDAAGYAKSHKMGIEEAGRELRYAYFFSLLPKIKADRIATAHTASDQCETVIMNLTRGASLSGLCGIPAKRDSIVRPILCFSSEEVKDYLSGIGQEYREDETNASDFCRRNRVRREVIPRLKEENPALEETLSRNCMVLEKQKRLLDSLCDRALAEVCSKDGLVTDKEKFRLLEDAEGLFDRVISRAMETLGLNMPAAERSEAVCRAACRAQAGKEIQLKNGAVFRVGQRELVFSLCGENRGESPPDYCRPLARGSNELKEIGARIILGGEKKDKNYKNINKMAMIMKLNSATIYGGLVARNPREGDRIVINGMRKSVKKLLCDAKYPQNLRRRIPLIADDEGILWIPGVGLCDRARPADESFFTMELHFSSDNGKVLSEYTKEPAAQSVVKGE